MKINLSDEKKIIKWTLAAESVCAELSWIIEALTCTCKKCQPCERAAVAKKRNQLRAKKIT